MFEVTSDDVALLSDVQLRTLIGLLCEADLRGRGYSTAAATWGGNQTAKDGGLDVRVSLSIEKAIDGFIPRQDTGYQVKKQDMPASAITAEMRPRGILRPIFKELADSNGAYIIVSSDGATSDTALKSRRLAMASAVGELPNANRLQLDFYDRTRLASWVRNHAGISVWVRSAVGRALPGWEPFGAWAYPKGGVDAEYLMDDGIRVSVLAIHQTPRSGQHTANPNCEAKPYPDNAISGGPLRCQERRPLPLFFGHSIIPDT
jgi:hypothetical protein